MPPPAVRATIPFEMAAVFDLNHPAHVVTWHFISLSVANLVVIVVMLLVFVLAIVVPFPHADEEGPYDQHQA
jgi:hypothetical protein